jgi:alanyl-tRNA synthetase
MKDFWVVLDHSRTALVAIYDGCLPSNTGGGSNIRNILRRSFAILKKRGWWNFINMEGYLEIFKLHMKDLEPIFGPFVPF